MERFEALLREHGLVAGD